MKFGALFQKHPVNKADFNAYLKTLNPSNVQRGREGV